MPHGIHAAASWGMPRSVFAVFFCVCLPSQCFATLLQSAAALPVMEFHVLSLAGRFILPPAQQYWYAMFCLRRVFWSTCVPRVVGHRMGAQKKTIIWARIRQHSLLVLFDWWPFCDQNMGPQRVTFSKGHMMGPSRFYTWCRSM